MRHSHPSRSTPPGPPTRGDGARHRRRTYLATLLGVLALVDASAAHAGSAPFEQVYASRARLVSRVPASGNGQRVIGFDGASSFVVGNTAYWSTGDLNIDGDGDGFYDKYTEPFGFRTGTIGRAPLRRPEKGVDLKLRQNAAGVVLPALQPNTANHECLFWPNELFEADSRLYFFFGIQYEAPACGAPGAAKTTGIGLGRLTDPGSDDLGPVREGTAGDWQYYLSPLRIGSVVYTFRIGAGTTLLAARVDEKHVASRDRYEYWTGPDTKWGGETNAVPLAQLEFLDGTPKIAFSAHLGRFLMIYACNTFSAICARTAKLPGATAAALESGFNEKTVLMDHPAAFYVTWHWGYVDSRHPERIYLTTARQPEGRLYYATWWELDLSAQPPAATRTFYYGGRDLYRDGPGGGAWDYATYDPGSPGAGLSTGTMIAGFGPPHPNPDIPPLGGFVGNETVAGTSAPGAAPNAVWPSETRGGAIVWTAPAMGRIEISSTMWLESTRGDNALGEIFLVRGGTVLPLWSKKLVAKWHKTRQRHVHRTNVAVQPGDRLVLGVRKGKHSTSNALNDLTYIDVSITLDRA